ncbi:MAG: hypothetical protein HY824_01855 [Acidobacteria bacterium]|nr:hypothetical protein [Acidobacteriota bacterium]
MRSRWQFGILLAIICLAACKPAAPGGATPEVATTAATIDSSFAAAPDSAWVVVDGLALIGFYPIVSNERLDADEGLSVALDDFSYHLSVAMDSLEADGFTLHLRGGDTLRMRTGKVRSRFVRAADSATIGYVFADTLGRRAVVYGVRTYVDLVEYAREFRATGILKPR